MTKEEKKVLSYLKKAWNSFTKLPVQHQDDAAEFRHNIHDLQRIIGIREVRRTDEEWVNELKESFFQ